jgi:hypothetical protein
VYSAPMNWGPVPVRDDSMRVVGAAVLALVLVLSSAIVYRGASAGRSWYPKEWDPRILPIATEVAALRGLRFKHPVQVRYLEPKDFEKQLGAGEPVDAAARAEAKRTEAVFRALGFIGGKTDLLKEAQTSEASGTLAFYSAVTQMVYVRGTTLDVAHRVTIAHELTHVLQDQNFGLLKLQKAAVRSNTGDLTSYKGLVEGDAVRIQEDYLRQLSPDERREYERENAAELARVGRETSTVPHILGLLYGAPYEFGPTTVRVLIASDGDTAINDALTGPTPSSAVYVQAGDVEHGVPVDPPLPPDDGVAVGQPEVYGPYEMYLAMATRLDPMRALTAADAVDGGSAITFERQGVICYSVLVDAATDSGKAFLVNAVRAWTAGRPGTSVDDSGAQVGFTACDPGKSVAEPPAVRLDRADQLLGVRFGLTAGFAKGGTDGADARCEARELVRQPGAVALVVAMQDKDPTAAEAAQIRPLVLASEAACRDDSNAGLP